MVLLWYYKYVIATQEKIGGILCEYKKISHFKNIDKSKLFNISGGALLDPRSIDDIRIGGGEVGYAYPFPKPPGGPSMGYGDSKWWYIWLT